MYTYHSTYGDCLYAIHKSLFNTSSNRTSAMKTVVSIVVVMFIINTKTYTCKVIF